MATEATQPTEKLIQHTSCFDKDTTRIERFRQHTFDRDYNSALTFVTEFYTNNNAQSLSEVLNLPTIVM
jgi:hypothetical protein